MKNLCIRLSTFLVFGYTKSTVTHLILKKVVDGTVDKAKKYTLERSHQLTTFSLICWEIGSQIQLFNHLK